jgi:Tfp pilus assembly protein PilO
MSMTQRWSFVAFVAALAVLAGGWFLLVSPKRGEAADLKSQATKQDSTNAGLVQQLAILKEQQADLPTQQARLAVLGQRIPTDPALPGLVRSLSAAARQSGVSLDELTPTTPVPLAGPVAAAPVAAPATTTDSSSTDATSDTSAPAPVAAPAAPTLLQIPLEAKVSGSFFELEQFVNKLEGLQRSFLVSGFTIAPLTASGAAATTTTTTTATGDLVLTLQGRVFLAPKAVAAAPTTPVAAATTAQ